MEGSTPTLLTQRNDCLLNSYNPVQLSAWRANVDMQYIVSRNRVLNYIAKFAAKSEPRSKGLKAVYGNTQKSDGNSLKMVQKLMISSVGERDYSLQETCHLLLGLPMYRASRDFVILSLDGSRLVGNDQEEGTAVVTLASQLDHLFDCAVVLDRVMRQAGQDAGQERFRNLLLRLRNAEEDWKYLMTRTTFDDALRLYPTIEAVAEHNVAKLRASGQPIAVLRAVHTG